MIRFRVHQFTVEISAIAQSRSPYTLSDVAGCFENRFSDPHSKDLASVLDSFRAVVQMLPQEAKDPVTIVISQEAPESRTERKDPDSRPAFSFELKKADNAGYVNVLLHVSPQDSFQINFKQPVWKTRSIQMKQMSLRLSPLNGAAMAVSRNSTTQDQPTIVDEAHHLVDRALSVIGQVCEAVEFDDVALVPGMLAEAVLRVIRPKTTFLKLEQVSVGVVVGDDPITLTKTVSVTDLDVSPSQPQRYVPHVDSLHVPSRYSSNITYVDRKNKG